MIRDLFAVLGIVWTVGVIALALVACLLGFWPRARRPERRVARAPRPTPRPVTPLGHYSRFNPQHPHPLREPTLRLEADSEEQAWAVLERSVA